MNAPNNAPEAPKNSLIPADMDSSEKRMKIFKELLNKLKTADTKKEMDMHHG